MINFLKWLFPEKVQFMGIRDGLDNLGQKDVVDFREVVAKAGQPEWIEKPESQWRTFLPQYQSTSSACVAFTLAKIAQILYWQKTGRKIKFSPGWIYRQRNPKGEGMWINDAIKLASQGMITEELYPSENLTEKQINSLPDYPYGKGVAEEFAISPNWVELPIDFDTVATTVQKTGKGIMIWVNVGSGEWFRKRFPTIVKFINRLYNHSVTVVDAFKWNGKEYLLIEDSAEKLDQQKLVSREQFQSMVWLARYPKNFKFDTIDKPKFDGSVSSMQDCLTYERFFPADPGSTGFWGSITEKAVVQFCQKYNLANPNKNINQVEFNNKLKQLYN